MIDKLKNLTTMLNHFPSWMDIRKRYNKSVGGALLQSYNDEIDNANAAIKEYQDLFFLLSYYKKENDIPAYMYIALIGSKDLSSISIPVLQHKEYLTNNVDEFYKNLSTHILYQDDALIIHPSFFDGKEVPDGIEYIIDNTYKYKSKLYYRHIWNVFDEFALFSGIKRYENESNEELSNRVLQQFRTFPNASEQGLKNAIKNALCNIADINDDDISIEATNNDNLLDSEIYDDITSYNRDLFRVKKWDTSLWEHGFKSVDVLPHEWDKQPDEYQDGTGSCDDLYTNFVNNIDVYDYTDIKVSGYKKSRKAIIEYLKNHNIETNIKLMLSKFKNNISPQKIEYKITASDIIKVNAEKINIIGSKKYSGKNSYYIEDYETELDGVDKIERNILDAGKNYQLVFEPVSSYSDMRISKIDLVDGKNTKSLLKENGVFIFKNKELVNKNVLAHVTSLSDMLTFNNLKNYNGGFILESISEPGVSSILVNNEMSFGIINIDLSCREANITDNSGFVEYEGFVLDDAGRTLSSSNVFGVQSTIKVSLPKCRSFSFNLDASSDASKQGAIYVTITRDGVKGRTVLYTKSTTISMSYRDAGNTEIFIQRAGQNAVSISDIKTAMYDIRYNLDGDSVITNAMYTMLPSIKKDSVLNIEIESYTAFAPVIKSVHIGKSLLGAKYTVDFNTNNKSKIFIDSTCNVTLINKTDGTKVKNYNTKALYKNNHNVDGYIFLDMSTFSNIISSSPAIKHKFSGTAKDFIILKPGAEIDNIVVDGDNKKAIYMRSLSSILYNNELNYEVYVSRAMQSFIVKHKNNEKLMSISKSDLAPRADIFEITGINNQLSGLYIVERENNNIYIGNSFDKNFQFICLCPSSSHEYIAYNSQYIFRKTTDNIYISNTFSPIISFTKKYLFVISDVCNITRGEKTTVSFYDENGERNWSASSETKIKITSNIEFNNEDIYDTEVSEIHDKYILSNDIILNDTYVINGEEVELAEYIVTPPDGMEVKYDKYMCEEDIIAEDDGFNKLKYSNIVSIISVQEKNKGIVPYTEYRLLKKEGILIWENEDYVGKELIIKYVVNKPTSIIFTDEDLLYEKVKYNIDAYDKTQTFDFYNAKDGDVIKLQFAEKQDKIIIVPSNDNFYATLSNDKKIITVSQINDPNKIAVHNGFLYEGGLEYYFFADKYEDEDSRTKELEMINTSLLGNKLLFRTKSTNYLPFSSMTVDTQARSSNFDFRDKKYKGISDFNSLTACDTFGHWVLFNTTAVMTAAINTYGINFKAKNNEVPSYAILEITNQIKSGNIVSVFKNGESEIYLCKESKVDKLPLVKDIYIEEKNIIKFSEEDKYFYHIFENDAEPETRYFIMIYGKECTIDDIVSMPYTSIKNMIKSHTKNINMLNINIIEKPDSNSYRRLAFNYDNAIYDNTERSSTKPSVITTSMNTSYGHTKIADIDIKKAKTVNARYKHSYIITEDVNAVIETEPVFVKSRKSVSKLIIKVNDIMLDNMCLFDIDVYGSSTKNGTYRRIKKEKSTNIAIVENINVKSYIKVIVNSKEKNKIINNISIYAEYVETTNGVELLSTPNISGTFTSMIYDIGASTNIMPVLPDYTINNSGIVEFYYRGARENKNTVVFTDWYIMNNKKNESYNHVLNNYRFIQFKAKIKSSSTEVSIKDFIIKII